MARCSPEKREKPENTHFKPKKLKKGVHFWGWLFTLPGRRKAKGVHFVDDGKQAPKGPGRDVRRSLRDLNPRTHKKDHFLIFRGRRGFHFVPGSYFGAGKGKCGISWDGCAFCIS